MHNTLYIRTQNSQDGRTRIYTFFTQSPEEKFGIRFLLTAHENFEQDFRQEIDDKKIEGGYGYITILPIAQANPVFTTDNGTQITLTRDGMRISQANALATNLDDVFGDEKAQTTIHLYILALAYSTKLTTIDQETIRAFKEEKFQKILIFHSEIVDLNPSIPLNPAKQDTWKIRELWKSIATHTNLQKPHNKVKERIIMLTKSCDSSSQRNTEIEIFIFTMVSVCLTALYTVKEFLTSPVEIATYALLIPALFLALIAWLSIISKEKQTKPLKFITWCLLFFASIFALAFAYVTTQNNSFASPRKHISTSTQTCITQKYPYPYAITGNYY